MTDLRRYPANDEVAHRSVKNPANGVRVVDGQLVSIGAEIANLRRSPNGDLDRQVLFGSPFLVLDIKDGWAFGQCPTDAYVGYVQEKTLTGKIVPTHRIKSFGSHVYPHPNMKVISTHRLPFAAQIEVLGWKDGFAQIGKDRWIPIQHVELISSRHSDFVETALRFLTVPYLWGGDSAWGIDCSGLVQQVLALAGIAAPRDSDMQEQELGEGISSAQELKRGDLVFWKGHVAILIDNNTIIHANAHHMAVTIENLDLAVQRIEASGGGMITAKRRVLS